MGKYTDENGNVKFGVWIYGKRNRWLDDEEVNLLMEQNDEYYNKIIEFKENNYVLSGIEK